MSRTSYHQPLQSGVLASRGSHSVRRRRFRGPDELIHFTYDVVKGETQVVQSCETCAAAMTKFAELVSKEDTNV